MGRTEHDPMPLDTEQRTKRVRRSFLLLGNSLSFRLLGLLQAISKLLSRVAVRVVVFSGESEEVGVFRGDDLIGGDLEKGEKMRRDEGVRVAKEAGKKREEEGREGRAHDHVVLLEVVRV